MSRPEISVVSITCPSKMYFCETRPTAIIVSFPSSSKSHSKKFEGWW